MFNLKIYKETEKIFVDLIDTFGLFFTFSNFRISRLELNCAITIQLIKQEKIISSRFLRGSLYSQSFKDDVLKIIADLCIPNNITLKKETLRILVEEIFSNVILAYQKIDDFKEENPNVDISKDIQYLYYPLILERVPNLIFGEGGSGKSLLAIYLGLLISQKMNVLYIDYEAEEEIWQIRTKKIRVSNDIPQAYKFLYYRAYIPFHEMIEFLKWKINKENIGFVIIDSLGKACMGLNLIEAHSASIFFSALDELKVNSLVISHIAKEKQGIPYGSVFFYNFARNIFEVEKYANLEDNSLYLSLINTKNNYAKLSPPIYFWISFADNKIEIIKVDEIPQEHLYFLDTFTQIKLLLQRYEALSTKEIAKMLEKNPETIRKIIQRHKEYFVRISDKWALKIPNLPEEDV